MSLNIANLIQDGSDAGFTWELGEVQYEPTKGTKVSLGDAPHTKVTDVTKFEATFPGVIIAALNGTSIKVACQAVTRRMKLKNRQVTENDMRAAVINSLRGIKNRATVVTQRVFVWGGKEYATQLEAETAMREALEAKGLDADTIEEIVSSAFTA
jgi:hypothetical protein